MKIYPLLSLAAALALAPVAAAQVVWSGAFSGAWHDDANWVGGVAPVSADTTNVVFTGSSSPNVSLASAWTLRELVFDVSAGNFTFSGETLSIAWELDVRAGIQTFENSLAFGELSSVNVKTGATLELTGGGAGILYFNYAADPGGENDASYGGTLTLSGTHDYEEVTTFGGTLQVQTTLTTDSATFWDTDVLLFEGATIDSFAAATFNGDSQLSADFADAITGGEYQFHDNATLVSSTAGAVSGGYLEFSGDREIFFNAGVVTNADIVLTESVSLNANVTGLFVGTECTCLLPIVHLQDFSSLTISAAGAFQYTELHVMDDAQANFAATGGFVNSLLMLDGNAVVTLNAHETMTDSAVMFYSTGDGNGGTIDLNGHDLTLTAVVGFGLGGTTAEGGWFTNTAPGAATLTLDIADASLIRGNISNSGGGSISIVKNGVGDLVLGTAADPEFDDPGSVLDYTGPTTVNAGSLFVLGNVSASVTTVNDGATLSGTGRLVEVTIAGGGTITTGGDPGSVGTLTVGDLTLASGATYAFHLLDADGVAGSGWSFLDVEGLLDLSATAGSLTLKISSGDFYTTETPLNFNPAQSYSFTIARFGTMTGFTPAVFALLGGDNASIFPGAWSVSQAGDELRLNYTAVPEPATYAAIAGLLMLGVVAWRRRSVG